MKVIRVLVIEDEALIALLFEDLLTAMGHEIGGSERTVAGAIAAASQCRPDLIIADVRLQDGSGIDAVAAILKTRFVPHIFVSGDVLDRASLHPAAAALQKPFREQDLVKAIRYALGVPEAPAARTRPAHLPLA